MDANHVRFKKRLSEIDRQHRRYGAGYVRLEERDGILMPSERVRVRRGLPVRGIVLALFAFLAFKAFLFIYLGPVTYVERVAALEQGNIVEQMGAWAMRPDLVTLYIAERVEPLLPGRV